ncbi:hypothetical protein IPG41_01510 [Candidatus Peregrinibacteria bacterium]|nr:MAG: hypothetical protein IPG41_01510 [Candidatus Peregrinibacteria bacterium]
MKKILLFIALSALLLNGCVYPEDVTVTIDAPSRVQVGETFDIVLKVTNESTESQTLTSIDVGLDYLEGILMEESVPAYVESWEFDFFGFMSFDYKKNLPLGESLEISFLMDPITPGDYSGALDVCVNTEMACIYNTVRTVVEESELEEPETEVTE